MHANMLEAGRCEEGGEGYRGKGKGGPANGGGICTQVTSRAPMGACNKKKGVVWKVKKKPIGGTTGT